LKKPLLMLYFLKGNGKENSSLKEMPALGMSFPSNGNGESKIVKLRVNTVFLENLGDGIDNDEE